MSTYVVNASERELNNVVTVATWGVSPARRKVLGGDAGPQPTALLVCSAQSIKFPTLINAAIQETELPEIETEHIKLKILRLMLCTTMPLFGDYWDDNILGVVAESPDEVSVSNPIYIDFDREIKYFEKYSSMLIDPEDFLENMERKLRDIIRASVSPGIQHLTIESGQIKADVKTALKKLDTVDSRLDQVLDELKKLREPR